MRALKLCLLMLYHPITVGEYIVRHRGDARFKAMGWITVGCILAVMLGVNIFSIYYTHFPLSTVSVRKANLLLECGKLFVPVLTWILASYLMTTILDGATTLSEAILYNCLALTPYVLFTVPITLLSRILDLNQAGLYGFLTYAVIVWVVALMLIGLKNMNDYTVGKTALIILLTLFTMLGIWATVVLLFTIFSQFVTMIKEVYYEVIYRMR